MLIVFFDVRGILHTEFVPQGHTVNQHIYRDVLRRVMRSVHEKRSELYEKKSWLLHDNAPVHNALSIREFLAKNNIAVLEQPVSKAQGSHERNAFSRRTSNYKSRDEGAPSNPKKILPGVHGGMAEEDGKVR